MEYEILRRKTKQNQKTTQKKKKNQKAEEKNKSKSLLPPRIVEN